MEANVYRVKIFKLDGMKRLVVSQRGSLKLHHCTWSMPQEKERPAMQYICLDSGKTSSQICLQNEDGELIECRLKTEREQFAKVFGQRPTSRISAATWTLIESLVRRGWSPEQVSGWLSKEKNVGVSYERIYQYIYADKARGGTLFHRLRCRKKRRKRYGSYDRRGQMPNCRSIEERPQIVEQRKRLGDWEADTIIGQNRQQAILSLVERKSKLCLLKRVERNTALAVEQAIEELLRPLTAKVKTITSDNGREFANHRRVEKKPQANFYFAHPFAAWERGTNENTNGLVRQYFPKGSDFSKITESVIQWVTARLNNRPRKRLSYRTPQRVFFKE